MTGNKVLLDTNIIIDLFRGDQSIAQKLEEETAIVISSIVLGELYTGINRSVNKAKQASILNEFLKRCEVVSVDKETAEYFGVIMAQLYKKGKPIPTNDIWIGALALQLDMALATRDSHFNEIENIKLYNW